MTTPDPRVEAVARELSRISDEGNGSGPTRWSWDSYAEEVRDWHRRDARRLLAVADNAGAAVDALEARTTGAET